MFCDALKGPKQFDWTKKYENAFQELKKHMD